ncbi:hypothetical protein SAMN05428949_4381 [Chitinophaga sp. YR627]|jgi:hypothetical protein|uniref:Uncharacterized protein n=1 Tax=Chitinophaga pinensis (strain ATCC 43595 / DSM 2588 / LMG 13176 / NBRC 15968 / NCIMB 11800 / UQM 2034) TaxID=485918 RepID=A0A979GBS8_CHIPD|nr:hypothetical protein Cpin_7023 [Chitinophaga pinensis DSM 2588]SFO18452.1 hypothetical protein SAMN05428949_4381 [Chitinophaga sp. YR627]
MQQERSGNTRTEVNYRSLGELIRGIFFVLFGLYAIFAQKYGLGEFQISQTVLNILGGVLIAYGLFRVYRGVRYLFHQKG